MLAAPLANLRSQSSEPQAATPGVWRIGIEPDILPISSMRADGRPTGFAPELLIEILNRRGIRYEVVVKNWLDLLNDFRDQKVDVLASAAFATERLRQMAFSEALIDLSAGVAHKRSLNLPSPVSLRGLRIAAQRGGRIHAYAAGRGWGQSILDVDGLDPALLAIAQGKADAAIVPRIIAFKRIQDLRLDELVLHKDSLPGTSLSLHFAVHTNDQYRLSLINDGLADLIRDRSYHQLREQWFGPYEVRPQLWGDLAPYIIPAFLVALLAIVALLLQHRRLRRLRRNEARLTLVLEGSGDAVWDWDLKSDRIQVGPRWGELWRDPKLTGLIELSALESRVHPEHLEKISSTRMRLLAEDMPLDFEFRLAEHPAVWLHMRGSVFMRSQHGAPLRACGTCNDVSARKSAEIALRESQRLLKRSSEMLHQAQLVAHIGAWEYEVDADRLAFSDAVAHMIDAPAGSQTPSPAALLERVQTEYRDFARKAVFRALTQAEGFDLELPLRTMSNRALYVRCICVAEHEAGKVLRLYGSVQDITEHRAVEESRAELQRSIMETQRFESLGALSGGIAHDFNNLLTVVISNASLARLDLPEGSPLHQFLGQIESAGQHAAEICRQMLVYSGQASFSISRIHIASLVKEIRTLIDLTLGRQGNLILDIDSDSGFIMADRNQLQQLILSLVQNSAEARKGGSLTVSLRAAKVRMDEAEADSFSPRYSVKPGYYLCLSVVDDGCGMDSMTMKRIFEPFFSTKFAGRGLGLAAVHGIVRAHDGAIAVESEPGRGTAFRIYLPASNEEVPAIDTSTAKAPSSSKRKRVLVADDEDSVRSILVQMLSRKSCDALEANDGRMALDLARHHAPTLDAVMLDLNMPAIGGAEVLVALRKDFPCLPVALVTGASESETAALFEHDPCVYCLSKPFNMDALSAFLTWLEKTPRP